MTQDEIDAIESAMNNVDENAQPDMPSNPRVRGEVKGQDSANRDADLSSSEAKDQVDRNHVLEGSEEAAISQEQVNTHKSVPEGSPMGTIPHTPEDRERGNIDFLLDVPLDVSVELGRTKIAIKDMLQLGPGSVIELDKLIGEPVDLLVNDKPIARGEVVVFDENFGIRITDIINPEERIRSLG